MSTPLVEVRDLTRRFGNVLAVDGLSFDLMPGGVVGLIGANGAGKTTTMRILASLDLPDSGSVRVGGFDILEHPHEVRRRVGWMPDHFTAYKDTTVRDYLDFFARAGGLRGPDLHRRLGEIVEFTDLGELEERPMDKLSKGQTQRLCLARTLLQDPDLLILDEPAAGLDPKARIEFKNLVRILRDRGKTLLISSHILSELGEMCDTLLFVDRGRTVHHGDAHSVRTMGTAGETIGVDILVAGPVEPLVNWLTLRPGWKITTPRRTGVRAVFVDSTPEALAAELRRLTADGIAVIDFHREERRLEDAFVAMLREPPPLPGNGRSSLAGTQ